ncbi:hypothetical protein [Paenibacillus illinoisensis]|uniref:hypothetical protein n=1 Tax=Paenibacillus illinoisensis TaxID=59845 RepID=UPI001C8D9E86|nr:hypothetical protein [Paenibacillus illinoisensis]MBY0217839.1 hypothetical protein [Paenibacillus illinoisensis]
MTITIDRASYKLGEIVLSKHEPFTIDEILNDLRLIGVEKKISELDVAMNRLKANGVIGQWGSMYSVFR